MNPDQAKAYCVSQSWCIGFEYEEYGVYFKNRC
jgi:hypothetical protein